MASCWHIVDSRIGIGGEAGKVYWQSRRGHGPNQAICEASRTGAGSTALEFPTSQTARRGFCVREKIATAPLCDGSHHRAYVECAAADIR
jgi:hypothetical protein